ncbi:proteinase inhibitor I4 serpin [filamentous cyanobacterium CCP1]|nr:proteinase inhibitor I4 serpin [filamentous cyanobacterium CCP2]PSB54932.1 proteinase inhibitor I4 serpin [filamentous cyanobacterium CCP1]
MIWRIAFWAGWVALLSLIGYLQVEARSQSIAPDAEPNQETEQVVESDSVPGAREDTNIDPRLVSANTRFGLQLFSQLQQETIAENLLISPSSVVLALTMTYNGANGTTQQAMAEALQLQGLSLAEVNQANAALYHSLENADQVTLSIANALWARDGFDFNADFLQRNQTFYQAEITALDFASPQAVSQINEWVSQNTEGKIPTIVDQLSPDAVLYLMNAIYFKGNWTTPFDPDITTDRPFYLPDGTEKRHPMMQQEGRLAYYETEQFQAVALPYGDDRRLSMYIFLPQPDYTLEEFSESLTPENWDTWMAQFSMQTGTLQLPRFTFEYSTSLNDALSALGMSIAFSDQADFSNLSNEPTAISEVLHKTFIEVNEEGTEAAAATSVEIITLSAPVDPPFQMTVDRPFFFAIRDNQTQTVLFLGSVIAPE